MRHVGFAALLAALLAAEANVPRAATMLFATDIGRGSLYSEDPATGAATEIGPLGFSPVLGLAFAPDGTLYGADATGELLTIDPNRALSAQSGS